MFKQGKLTEAGQILFENNPLSAICALICNHEQQCAGHCVLGKKSTPVHFSSIENYISEMYLDRMTLPKPEPKGKKVAVIGMGNAAMDVARTALRNGSQHVMLFSRDNSIAASSNEVAYAKLDGAEFIFGKQIHHITELCTVHRMINWKSTSIRTCLNKIPSMRKQYHTFRKISVNLSTIAPSHGIIPVIIHGRGAFYMPEPVNKTPCCTAHFNSPEKFEILRAFCFLLYIMPSICALRYNRHSNSSPVQ